MKKIIFFLMLSVLTTLTNAQWTQLTSPSSNTLYCLYFNNALTGYLSGATSGSIIKTTNGCSTWSFHPTGTSSTFYDMRFLDLQTGFVAGSTQQVIKTTNAGVNWDIKSSGSGTLYSVSFPSALVGYAVGGGFPAVLMKSTDGGNNWNTLIAPTSNTVRGVYFVTPLLGWLCGSSGTLWKTTDGCVSWIPQTQSTSYSFEKIQFLDANTGFVIGSSEMIMKTSNGGTNWTAVSTGSSTLYDVQFVNTNTGWAVGSLGKILCTSNGGNIWYQQTSPSSYTLNSINMIDANTGYIVGASGVLLKTTNGGGFPAQIYFVKFPSGPLTTTTNASNRCAFGDYDNDGYLDIVVSTYNDSCMTCTYPLLLFHNVGFGFERIMTGPIATVTSRTFGVSWGDYDNDSKLDLFVCVGFYNNNLLFHNEGNGNFSQITSGSIVNDGGFSEASAWCDYDRDGWLDLFVANGQNSSNLNFLYHNNANGTFTKVTSGSIVNDVSYSRGCSWGDYDNDMWPDLFVVNYQGQNDFLYHNNGNGTFTRITSGPHVNDGMWGSGCCWGDYDNDGFLDLYVTNNNQQNRLYHNDHNGNFSVVSGGPSNESGYSYGCSWGDYDNDGFIDLFMAKLYTYNALYKNLNGQSFVKITNEIPTYEGGFSAANAWGDYNVNGKLDLFVTNNRLNSVNFLYINVGLTGNYLVLKLKGCNTPTGRSNNDGIGARVKVRDGNATFIREVSGGMGMGQQDMFWQHFGLGNISNVDSVIVYWPSGNIQKLSNVAANQILLIDECTVGITENKTPVEYALEQNFPNPFNPLTTINYSIKKKTLVIISIYDITGRFIKNIVDADHTPGKYSIEINGTDLSSGVYIYKLQSEEFTAQKKMVIIK